MMEESLELRTTDKNNLERSEYSKHRSDETAHIIERMPGRFGWWVSAIVIFLISVMLLFGFLVKYPEILKGQIRINAQQANIKLNAKTSGTL